MSDGVAGAGAGKPVPDQIQGRNPHYVNHDDELNEAMAAARAAAGNHIVVLAGSPGVGKTAAGIELSFRVRDEYPSGRLLGSLDQLDCEVEVLKNFLLAMGETSTPDRLDALRTRYQALTAGRKFLVFLDGATSVEQVRRLLPGDGASLVVVTEGRPLSMLQTTGNVTFLDLSPLEDEPARELLGRLAGADRVAAEPEAVSEVIRLCGHLPIALCVVGVLVKRSRIRTFASLAERLQDVRRRLATLSINADLSVITAFTAAYRLLGDSAQLCYRGFGLRPRTGEISAAALAAALDLPDYEVIEALAELADSRLVEEIADDRVAVRELMQLHAENLNEATPQVEQADRLSRYYITRCAAADDKVSPSRPWRQLLFPKLERGEPFASEPDARRWLRTERANLRAAVEHAYEQGHYDLVVRWCVLLWPFYEKEKFLDDLFATHRLGVKAAWRLSDQRSTSLIWAQQGYAHYWLRDLDDAAKAFTTAIDVAREVGSIELEATATEGLGVAQLALGRDDARALLERNFELAKRIGDERWIALARFHLAKAVPSDLALGLLDEAEQALAGLTDDETENLTKVAIWRGKKLTGAGRFGGVAADLTRALGTMAARGRRFDESEILDALGDLASAQNEPDKAAAYYNEAVSIVEDLGFTAQATTIGDKLNRLTDGVDDRQ